MLEMFKYFSFDKLSSKDIKELINDISYNFYDNDKILEVKINTPLAQHLGYLINDFMNDNTFKLYILSIVDQVDIIDKLNVIRKDLIMLSIEVISLFVFRLYDISKRDALKLMLYLLMLAYIVYYYMSETDSENFFDSFEVNILNNVVRFIIRL